MKTPPAIALLPVLAAAFALRAAAEPPERAQPVETRVAFGSCSRPELPQPLWSKMAEAGPDAFVWLGDNVYGDTEDMAVLRARYAAQKARPEYESFRQFVRILGTWDDHDYGANDAGKEYPKRAESQQALLDFLDEPADSPRRRREGVYASHTLGRPPRELKVILLDTRYHRDPPSEDGDILGAAQWEWLERELSGSRAAGHLIASSIQVVAEDHRFEKWANFPAARRRLFDLVARIRPAGLVFISGDRHYAELSRMTLPGSGLRIVDLTSSSLTHASRSLLNEMNRHRVAPAVGENNFGLVTYRWDAGAVRLEVRGAAGTLLSHEEPLDAPAAAAQ